MRTRRELLLSAVLTSAALLSPYRVAFLNRGPSFTSNEAAAQGNSGGNGGGNSGGNGGGNGGGNSGGSGGGNGSGNGNSGGNGGGNGGGNNGGNSSGRSSETRETGRGTAPDPSRPGKGEVEVRTNGSSITVRHPNGTVERIVRNRYEMRDARNRRIVNRRATASDRARLRSFR
ncbi:hypothetical protein [Pseudorhizobium flavum]|uniref:Uncharacterized protein n=1 Tax=Pseudorhizobium flavum TaxID=1335061 RepID=A0A7W9Z0F5_9HYPH|nr:hypothetical protein [Pseudorhizobium flavum]MBB6181765.1 hypothetical protein [Pseudorhizobium flavum]CAD6616378.1 hypothetical protein RFYW14_03116 [Pseudorhizobium flavum]